LKLVTLPVRGSSLLSAALFTCSKFGAIFLNRIVSNNQQKQYRKILVYEPRTWTNLGAIFLPGLTTPSHKNRKIQYENELLKAKEPTPDV
jgi:hypothetical protein